MRTSNRLAAVFCLSVPLGLSNAYMIDASCIGMYFFKRGHLSSRRLYFVYAALQPKLEPAIERAFAMAGDAAIALDKIPSTSSIRLEFLFALLIIAWIILSLGGPASLDYHDIDFNTYCLPSQWTKTSKRLLVSYLEKTMKLVKRKVT